jgi:hypothetical protein
MYSQQTQPNPTQVPDVPEQTKQISTRHSSRISKKPQRYGFESTHGFGFSCEAIEQQEKEKADIIQHYVNIL